MSMGIVGPTRYPIWTGTQRRKSSLISKSFVPVVFLTKNFCRLMRRLNRPLELFCVPWMSFVLHNLHNRIFQTSDGETEYFPIVKSWFEAISDPLWSNTLPETNSSPLKMDGWNTTFLLGRPIFRGYVSFREGNIHCQTAGKIGKILMKIWSGCLDSKPLYVETWFLDVRKWRLPIFSRDWRKICEHYVISMVKL